MNNAVILQWSILLILHVTIALCDSPTINPSLLEKSWPARWITCPDYPGQEFGVFHFRRSFDLSAKPTRFVIHLSADNRYRLFVNGTYVCDGPAAGDLDHWRFETVDIAEHLKQGTNVLAVEVWNWGQYMPLRQVSHRTAFVMQGNGKAEQVVNTDSENWKVLRNPAYMAVSLGEQGVKGYIVVPPGDRIDGALYLWGWESVNYNDSQWQTPGALNSAYPRGAVDASVQWRLVPRPIPFMEERSERFSIVRRTRGTDINPTGFLTGKRDVTVGPNQSVQILLDRGHLTNGYPELLVSRGDGSEIKLTYAEAMFQGRRKSLDRNRVDGLEIHGLYDSFLPDGGRQRRFRPLWFRTFRYLQIDIKTADQPLTIHDFHNLFRAYPFEERASFTCSDPSLHTIWDMSWRTLKLCASETYFDCPYYEQLQYINDVRIQLFISRFVGGDDRLARQAIQQLDESRLPDGLTLSRHPAERKQIIPPSSLFWVGAVYDYWMYHDDPDFVKSFLPGIRAVLGWYERRIDETGLVGECPWWNFIDWARWPRGVAPGADTGRSSIVNLMFVEMLNKAAAMADSFDRSHEAGHYRGLASSLQQAVQRHCWDEKRQLYADTPSKKSYSQHANIQAVLADALTPLQQKALMERVLQQDDLTECAYFWRFYLHRAIKKAGLGDRLVALMAPWRDMLAQGLSTCAEEPDGPRSDCHAASASPAFDFLNILCGIDSAGPGFTSLRIEPSLGPLQWAKGSVPHHNGPISVDLKRRGATGIKAVLNLPSGVTADFIWQGKSYPIKSGKQTLEISGS